MASCPALVDYRLKRYKEFTRYGRVLTPKRLGLPRDLVVPHSELAMHTRAAGKKLVAWACRERECAIVFQEPKGGCGHTFGIPSEVLPHEARRATSAAMGINLGRGGRRR